MSNQNVNNAGRFAEAKAKSEKLAVVILDFRQWTGAVTIKPEDFQIGDGGKLPPENVIVQLGQKAVIGREHLVVFSSLKTKAVRLLQSCGVPFLGGYAIAMEKAKDILGQLDQIKAQYEAEKASLISNYNRLVDEWIAANPEFAQNIRTAALSAMDVQSRIYARYSVVKVAPISDDCQEAFAEQVNGLSDRLFEEVAKDARKMSIAAMTPNAAEPKVRPRVALRRIRDRLGSLTFLDSGIEQIVRLVDGLLAKLRDGVKIEGSLFFEVSAIVQVLSDEEKMRAIASGALSLEAWQRNFNQAHPIEPKDEKESLFSGAKELAEAIGFGKPSHGESGFDLDAYFDQHQRKTVLTDAPISTIAAAIPDYEEPPAFEQTSFSF